MNYLIYSPCGDSYEIKFEDTLPLESLESSLGESVLAKTAVFLLVKWKDKTISIYKSGRILVRKSNREECEEIAKFILEKMEEGL